LLFSFRRSSSRKGHESQYAACFLQFFLGDLRPWPGGMEFLSAGDLALPNLIPAFAEDDNIGLFFSSCKEGERATCSFEGACSWGEI
jgi:hypothetical protein